MWVAIILPCRSDLVGRVKDNDLRCGGDLVSYEAPWHISIIGYDDIPTNLTDHPPETGSGIREMAHPLDRHDGHDQRATSGGGGLTIAKLTWAEVPKEDKTLTSIKSMV